MFLWDEKSGGTAFMQWLKYSARGPSLGSGLLAAKVWKLGKLNSSFM